VPCFYPTCTVFLFHLHHVFVSPAPFSCFTYAMFLSHLRSYILKKPFLMDGIMILPVRPRQGQVFMDEIEILPFHSWKEPGITRKKGGG